MFDDILSRVGRELRDWPSRNVDDTTVETNGVVLVDLPRVVQRAEVKQPGVVGRSLPPRRLAVLRR